MLMTVKSVAHVHPPTWSCTGQHSSVFRTRCLLCVGDIGKWMNVVAKDLLWSMWCYLLYDGVAYQPFTVCSSSVTPSFVVCDLCLWIDSGQTVHVHHRDRRRMFLHAAPVTQCWQIAVTSFSTRLVVALVLSRTWEYYNATGTRRTTLISTLWRG